MPDAGDLAELRDLQARAYGRSGGLTDAEAARLRALQARDGAQPVETREAERVAAVGAPRADMAAPIAESSPDFAHGFESPEVDAGNRWSLLAGRGRLLALAAVATLVCGVGMGWLLFGQSRAEAVALTAEQQEWQRDLVAEGVYDQGSVSPVAEKDGVVIWTATRDETERICLILSDGEITVPTCQPSEAVLATGMYGSIMVGDPAADQRQVSAQLLFSASGEPAVAVSSNLFSEERSGIVYANEAETRIAGRLAEDEGFDPNSIWVVGYDDDVPIWTAMKVDEPGSCLIHDGSTPDSPVVCADPQTIAEQQAGLVLNVVDPTSGATTRFELAPNGPTYLVITREGGALNAGGD
ncbi:hypothetical protein [Microbacterium sp. SA39]|uniref:hypothetical protein n=1 Tax=Microbacterium sp. SA39 TaxID=1263625 RepID=UPI0005FA2197|nr:hypothetical protein [Microbacterium sp. SA39]KJQ55051.1 hypothetical protein RS85_01110 [Microbacterium sp. SA39]